ncbi:MAG: putative HTH-type transcriptional regulator [Paraeggerthella hongkongensis]
MSGVPCYSISDVVDATGISAFTIRYYDKCGFFPDLARDHRGVRSFSQADITQLLFVDALRKSGLSIEGIQYFVKLQKRGAATQAECLEIVRDQETVLEYQISELKESLKRLHAASMELSASDSSQ